MSLSGTGEEVFAAKGARLHYGYVILAAGVITVVGCIGLARFGYNVVMPYMRQGLGLSNAQAGLIGSAGLVGYMLFSALGGLLASRYGARLVVGLSMLLAGVSLALLGLGGPFLVAALLQFLTGVGSAGANIAVMGLASAWFARRRRAMATGILTGGSGIGAALAGFVVPKVAGYSAVAGWRLAWLLMGLTVMACGAVGYLFLRNRPAELGLAPLGEEPPAQEGGCRQEEPAGVRGWPRVYRLTQLWYLGLVYFAFGFAYIIYGTFSSQTIVQDWGLGAALAGKVWAVAGIFAIFCGLFWGVLADRFGRLRILAVIYAQLAAANLVFALSTGSLAGLWISAVAFGFAHAAIAGIVAALCGDWVGGDLAPAALGFAAMFFAAGQAIGPAVAGYLADAFASFRIPYLVAVVVAGLGSLGCLVLRPPGKTG